MNLPHSCVACVGATTLLLSSLNFIHLDQGGSLVSNRSMAHSHMQLGCLSVCLFVRLSVCLFVAIWRFGGETCVDIIMTNYPLIIFFLPSLS